MRRLLITLAIVGCALTVPTQASAVVIELANGLFEVSYDFKLKSTLHGSDITDIVILETDGFQKNAAYNFNVASSGTSTLTHSISFNPTQSLVLGLDLAPIDSGLKDHLVVLMNIDFAEFALTKAKFSEVFPAIEGRERFRHSATVQAVKDANIGNSDAQQLLFDFFTEDAGKFAAFDPKDSFRIIEFSPPKPIDVVPEPATILLFGSGLAGLAAWRYRKGVNA